ncbi:DUF6414 family protein [Mycobacterium sp. WMMD1722]|uniref:DUF6414 family protein n=1 Tax=Mycobacterium sp. WMMD1722 TaxID=3404117 RepID=UPI003BF4AC48
MGLARWWNGKRSKFGKRSGGRTEQLPLREFVYLDEVSLVSLMSSVSGELKDEVSTAISSAEEAQVVAGATASVGLLKSDLSSKYQTSNSQSTQTKRKANIQSLFRDFRSATADSLLLESLQALAEDDGRQRAEVIADKSYCIDVDRLERGCLIEVTVELEADPIFRVSTMMSEIYDLGSEHPAVLGASSFPPEMTQMVKMLERLLTGLVPIRGTSVDLHVFVEDDRTYIARRQTLESLKILGRPLVVVGVTDHLSYWKDIRRILFSKSRFNMLCRISRDGVQREWTPVKLSDVFANVVPEIGNLSELVNAMSQSLLTATPVRQQGDLAAANALRHYAAQLDVEGGEGLLDGRVEQLEALVDDLSRRKLRDVAAQRAAFDAVASFVGATTTPQRAVEMRREARLASGMSLFPESKSRLAYRASDATREDEPLLDTEVIAIYW